MNNEKQHSEYKIIETVATPTFDGVSVETHPEDLLGGGDAPEKPISYFYGRIVPNLCAGKVVDGEMLMYGYDNGDIALYDYATKRLLDRRQTSFQTDIVDNAIRMAKAKGINVESGKISYEHPEYIDTDKEYIDVGLIWD